MTPPEFCACSCRLIYEEQRPLAAYDSLQWIIQKRESAKGKPEQWRGVSFISSDRDILVLTLREKGIAPDPVVTEKIMAMPVTFGEWIAQQEAVAMDEAA